VNKPMIAVAAVVLAAGIALAWFFHSHSGQVAHAPPSATAPAAPPPAEPGIEHPVPGPAASSEPLPALNDSDPAMREALGGVLGAGTVGKYLVPEGVVRHLVVTIDNLPRQKVAERQRPVVPAPGSFAASGDELHATLDPRNYERYAPFVSAVRGLDMQRVAEVYFHFYPLFQQAYQDLGYPNGYFNDRLVQVIDSLLATPRVEGPIALTRPNVLYVYADPALEARPAGQKLLLRMGPDNAAAIKTKLAELKTLITATPPPKH
jgi:hypothetical protein